MLESLHALPVPAAYALAVLGGYLLGSIPFGLVLTRAAGLGDIRAIGSGNIGATNVLRTGRKDIALATLVLDSAKAGGALALFRFLLGEDPGLAAGGAAFFGHCYPVWLRFQGGKGVATLLGVYLVGLWPLGVFACASWLAAAYAFRFSSLAALITALAAPAIALAMQRADVALLGAGLCALVYWRHRANIGRLWRGEEPKIGQKSSAEPASETAQGAAAP